MRKRYPAIKHSAQALPPTACLVLCVWLSFGSVGATEELKIGAPAPQWRDLPGIDGKKHALDDLKNEKALLVIFFDNTCPDCANYLERINAIAKQYRTRKVATVLINVNTDEENDLPHMKEFAQKNKLRGIYVRDVSQKIGKRFGARVTPTAYVFDAERRLVYRGAIDDHWKPESVKRHHLRTALDRLLAGKKIETPVTEAEGCEIDYED